LRKPYPAGVETNKFKTRLSIRFEKQRLAAGSKLGQNIGEDLMRNVLEAAFSLDGIEQVQLSVIAGNRNAIRLYEKLGFKAYGLQPKYFKVGNTYSDQQFMQLFKTEFRS